MIYDLYRFFCFYIYVFYDFFLIALYLDVKHKRYFGGHSDYYKYYYYAREESRPLMACGFLDPPPQPRIQLSATAL